MNEVEARGLKWIRHSNQLNSSNQFEAGDPGPGKRTGEISEARENRKENAWVKEVDSGDPRFFMHSSRVRFQAEDPLRNAQT